MFETVECPFCKNPGASPRFRFADSSIHRCPQCGLMFLHPRPSTESLKEVYTDTYFSNPDLTRPDVETLYGYVDYMSERINKQYGYQRVVEATKDMLSPQGAGKPRWLDIGCGLGYLLDVAFDNGFDVTGIEFNEYAVRHIRSRYRYPVHCGTVHDAELAGKFDVVSMMDVIEHLRDPFADLARIRGLVSERGVLVLLTMDCDSPVSRLLGKRFEELRRIREHLFFFSRRSIVPILRQHGFTVEGISSMGHTFRLGFLLNRLRVYSPALSEILESLVRPRWLLDANFHVNPGTKMIVFARPSSVDPQAQIST